MITFLKPRDLNLYSFGNEKLFGKMKTLKLQRGQL